MSLATKDPEYWRTIISPDEYDIIKLDGEIPDTKDCYQMKGVYYALYLNRDWTGLWHIFPEGWENSYSAVFSALNNYLTFMDPGEEAIALVKERFAAMQRGFETRFNDMTTRLKAEKDITTRQEIATRETSRMAEESQNLALALYRHIVYGEEVPEK